MHTTQHRDYEILIRADPDHGQSMLNMHSARRQNQIKKIVLHKRISALTSTGEKPGGHEKLIKLPKAR